MSTTVSFSLCATEMVEAASASRKRLSTSSSTAGTSLASIVVCSLVVMAVGFALAMLSGECVCCVSLRPFMGI